MHEGVKNAPLCWDEYIGCVGDDTHVGVVFSTAWSVRVCESHHDQTELSPEQVAEFQELLANAKDRLEHVRENWDELESEYRDR